MGSINHDLGNSVPALHEKGLLSKRWIIRFVKSTNHQALSNNLNKTIGKPNCFLIQAYMVHNEDDTSRPKALAQVGTIDLSERFIPHKMFMCFLDSLLRTYDLVIVCL